MSHGKNAIYSEKEVGVNADFFSCPAYCLPHGNSIAELEMQGKISNSCTDPIIVRFFTIVKRDLKILVIIFVEIARKTAEEENG